MSVIPIWKCLKCEKTVNGSICKCGFTHVENTKLRLRERK